MTFKAGDVVYCYSHGIVRLMEGQDPLYNLIVVTANGVTAFTSNGKAQQYDPLPSLITLEKAEKLGLVRKKVKPHKGLRVKYYDTNVEQYGIAYSLYGSRSDFEHKTHHDCLFVSFVDEELNECDPPQGTIEWEEI